jgi:flagellar protein FliS
LFEESKKPMYARQYVENDIAGRTPIELVRLLYSKALEKLRSAAEHTARGRVRERSQCLTRVMQIVAELQGALHSDGGEIARDLARLYDYAQQRLAEAAGDAGGIAPIDEVEAVLANLYEGWIACEPEADSAGPQDLQQRAANRERRNEFVFPEGDLARAGAPTAYSGAGRAWML